MLWFVKNNHTKVQLNGGTRRPNVSLLIAEGFILPDRLSRYNSS
jgi:hypothetical protein